MKLGIDTSSAFLSLALGDERWHVIDSLVVSETNSHNEKIARATSTLLEKNKVSPKEIRSLVIGSGPGSFTGLRIGFSFAKAFCVATGAELVIGDSFAAAAAASAADLGCSKVVVVADARKGEVFFAAFKLSSDTKLLEEVYSLRSVALNKVLRQDDPSLSPNSFQGYALYPMPGTSTDNIASLVQSLSESAYEIPLLRNSDPNIAVGLLKAAEHEKYILKRSAPSSGDISVEGMSLSASFLELEPRYLRKIEAKTIAEREQQK